MTVSERFLRYVQFDTQSDEDSQLCPSTPKQKKLGEFLVREMQDMGISDAHMDADGYVYGTVPGDPSRPTIGLIAHMDTSPDASGDQIKARIVEYHGGDILLSDGIVMEEALYPSLTRNRGKHLIVTDGTTLLGADDKAGIAEILSAVQKLLDSGEPHATVKLGFTPDEEVGRGADRFNLKDFGADFAYTADGGTLGELEYENFNAAAATVRIHGRNIHPGYAKNQMMNSQLIAMEFQNMLPVHERPEATEGYEGFALLASTEGCVEFTRLRYIIRDHDMDKFNRRKAMFGEIAQFLNAKYGEGTVEVELKDNYYNMKEKILPVMHIVERAKAAMESAGIQPRIVPVRGGTDGARLSFQGLPCPNLCTGGENFHGRFEYIPVEDMEQCVDMLVAILTA